jgi:solute carrier family 25 (mitochondrial carnitine/acylcarnitine transporter), member 20/29
VRVQGMAAPIASNAPINAVAFAVEGYVRRAWAPWAVERGWSRTELSVLAGVASGLAQAPITSVTELLKIRLQVERTVGGPAKFSGPIGLGRHLLGAFGARGLTRGMLMTAVRDAPGVSTYFVAYHEGKHFLGRHAPSLNVRESADPAQRVGALGHMLAGGVAGSASWLFWHPLDVLKTLVQSSDPGVSLRHLVRAAYADSGPAFLWRGLGASVVRAFPVSAVLFPIHEFLRPRIFDLAPRWN